MTINDKSAIILKEWKLPAYTKEKTITIKMEVYAEAECDTFPHNKLETALEKNKMTDLNTNLREAANCLIQLFYKTGKKYSCTRTKIGKLLSIVAFKFAVTEKTLFDERIYKYPPCCGTMIKDLNFIIVKSIYVRESEQIGLDDCLPIDEETIDRSVIVPFEYSKINSLSIDVVQEIKQVFLKFGAYPGDDLGKLLTPVADKISVGESGELDLMKLKALRNDFLLSSNNEIVDYIYREES